MPVYDISVPVFPSMATWPDDPPVRVSLERNLREHGYNLSHIAMGTHSGTHIDAPRHVDGNGLTVDRLPLEVLVGKAYVFEVEPLNGWAIRAEELANLGIPADATRVLLKTSNSELWHLGPQEFEHYFVYLSKQAARWLAGRGVRLVGVDYMSVDAYEDSGMTAHRELLGAGVVVVENLDLSRVQPGVYQLVVLPLKLRDVEGAPARAILFR